MPNSPIGVTFLPNEDNAAMGPKRGALEGDLAQAYKILALNLRKPRVYGAHAISSPDLLNSQGANGQPGGFNPHAAVFEAMLRSMGGGDPNAGPMGGGPMGSAPAPRVIPGNDYRSPNVIGSQQVQMSADAPSFDSSTSPAASASGPINLAARLQRGRRF